MEIEKRKRSPEKDDREERDRKTKMTAEDGRGVAVVVPTEEEVEEFFAIVRRMQRAVKYFEKSAGVGRDAGGGGRRGTWRAALESAEEEEKVVEDRDVGGDDRDDRDHHGQDQDDWRRREMEGEDGVESVKKKRKNEKRSNGGLDLNVEPDELDQKEISG